MSVAISTGTAIAIGLGAGTAAGTIYAANKASGATTQAATTESAAATQAAQLQTQAAKQAAALQYQSAQDALNFAKSVYTTKQGQVSPYIGMGQGALSALGSYLGVSPVAQPPVSFPASTTSMLPPSLLNPNLPSVDNGWTQTPNGLAPPGLSGGLTPDQRATIVRNTQLSNPNLTPAQVEALVPQATATQPNTAGGFKGNDPSTWGSPSSPSTTPQQATTSGVQPGTQRVINGQNAQWDGQGWIAVGS
jgi:hypothetical protein